MPHSKQNGIKAEKNKILKFKIDRWKPMFGWQLNNTNTDLQQ